MQPCDPADVSWKAGRIRTIDLICKTVMYRLASSLVQAPAAVNSCRWTPYPILDSSININTDKGNDAKGTPLSLVTPEREEL